MSAPWRAIADDSNGSGDAGDAVGVRQNARLTALTGLVLLVLLFAEGVTVLQVGALIVPHLVIGTVLLAPVALKLGSTGWKIVRYYAGSRDYVRAGPPPVVRRLLAPVVIVTSVGLFGTGAVLMLMGPSANGRIAFLHKAFFVLWFVAMTLHVLIHVMRSLRSAAAELTTRRAQALAGRTWRTALLAGTLVAGVGLAAWSAQYVAPWANALRR